MWTWSAEILRANEWGGSPASRQSGQRLEASQFPIPSPPLLPSYNLHKINSRRYFNSSENHKINSSTSLHITLRWLYLKCDKKKTEIRCIPKSTVFLVIAPNQFVWISILNLILTNLLRVNGSSLSPNLRLKKWHSHFLWPWFIVNGKILQRKSGYAQVML